MDGAGGKLEMRGARVGRELDGGAALVQRDGQRLGRKQMAAGAAGREQDEVVSGIAASAGHVRHPRSTQQASIKPA